MPLPQHPFPPGLTQPAPGQPAPIGKQQQPVSGNTGAQDWRKG